MVDPTHAPPTDEELDQLAQQGATDLASFAMIDVLNRLIFCYRKILQAGYYDASETPPPRDPESFVPEMLQ